MAVSLRDLLRVSQDEPTKADDEEKATALAEALLPLEPAAELVQIQRRRGSFFADLSEEDNKVLTHHYINRRGITLQFLRERIMPQPHGIEALTRLAAFIRDKRVEPSVTSYAAVNARLLDPSLPRAFARSVSNGDTAEDLLALLDEAEHLHAIGTILRQHKNVPEANQEAFARAYWEQYVLGKIPE